MSHDLRIECPEMFFENTVSRDLRIECPKIYIEYRPLEVYRERSTCLTHNRTLPKSEPHAAGLILALYIVYIYLDFYPQYGIIKENGG